MKWFKHISDSLDDPFINELLDDFGSDAYIVFFGTIEVYSREFSPELSWKLDVKVKHLCRKTRTSVAKLKKILSKIHKWEVEYKDDRVCIFIPKFTQLLDNYTRNTNPASKEKLASDLQETFQPIRIKNKEERIKNKEKDKTLYGECVLLTADEYKKLTDKHGQNLTDKAIELLNNYIQSSGKKYKSHYHTLLLWPMQRAQEAHGTDRPIGRNERFGVRQPELSGEAQRALDDVKRIERERAASKLAAANQAGKDA